MSALAMFGEGFGPEINPGPGKDFRIR